MFLPKVRHTWLGFYCQPLFPRMRWMEESTLLKHCILTVAPPAVRIYWSVAAATDWQKMFQHVSSTKSIKQRGHTLIKIHLEFYLNLKEVDAPLEPKQLTWKGESAFWWSLLGLCSSANLNSWSVKNHQATLVLVPLFYCIHIRGAWSEISTNRLSWRP